METEREDGDTYDEDREAAPGIRKWLMDQALKSRDPTVNGIMSDLFALERMASPFFLGTDYDEDLSDYEDLQDPN